jgi:hypothetical protein
MLRLCAAVEALGLSADDVWLAYFACSGNAPFGVLASWLDGRDVPTRHDYNILAVVVNEALEDRGLEPDIPYSFDARNG